MSICYLLVRHRVVRNRQGEATVVPSEYHTIAAVKHVFTDGRIRTESGDVWHVRRCNTVFNGVQVSFETEY